MLFRSAASNSVSIDLNTGTPYSFTINGQTTVAKNFERLGTDGLPFQTGTGNDVIIASRTSDPSGDDDWINTNGGDDLVQIFLGRDQVNLGGGIDTLKISWGDIDKDVIYYGGAAPTYSVYIAGDYEREVDFLEVEKFDLAFGSGNDSVVTGDFGDTIDSGAGADTIQSGLGPDQIDAGAGIDRWIADLSAASNPVSIDLNTSTPYSFTINGQTTVAKNFERLGKDGLPFQTGAGNDVIIEDRKSTRLNSSHRT